MARTSFKRHDFRNIGVEPANIAHQRQSTALANSVEVLHCFPPYRRLATLMTTSVPQRIENTALSF